MIATNKKSINDCNIFLYDKNYIKKYQLKFI